MQSVHRIRINSDLGKEDNQVDEAIKSNDESEERLEPPPNKSPVWRRRYRPPEGFVPRRSERIHERDQTRGHYKPGEVVVITMCATHGLARACHMRVTCILISVFKCESIKDFA